MARLPTGNNSRINCGARRRRYGFSPKYNESSMSNNISKNTTDYSTIRREAASGKNYKLLNSDNYRQSPENCRNLELIGLFTVGIAHDFNNLLTAIIGNSQLALSRISADDGLSRRLREIEKAGLRAAELSERLLSYSRGEKREFQMININDAVAGILPIIERIIGKDYSLFADYEPDLSDVFASTIQIEQILLNLCVNARDAMPRGGIINVSTNQAVCGEKHFVKLVVGDHGTGISHEIASQIFDAFFTTKKNGKGTGLGLHTVSTIVHECGGFIEFHSQIGSGTVFEVYLPAIDR